MYSINFITLVNWLLPSSLRKPGQIAWLKALVSPVSWLHTRFENFVVATQFDLKITGQVRSLEYHLNRVFYPVGGPSSIYITDGSAGTTVYMFLESENNPVYLPVFISGASANFIVHVPNSLEGQELAIRAFIDRYKLPSKIYELLFDIIVI